MDAKVKQYINDLSDWVRNGYCLEIPLLNIEELVNRMGGRLLIDKSGAYYDGTIRKVGDTEFEIKISSSQGNERKNFTVAHELGHLFIHMGFRTDYMLWNSQGVNDIYHRFGNSEQEIQANEFAASILMPRECFIEKVNRCTNLADNTVDIAKVAAQFNVSTSAAIYRGKNLGVLI